MPSVPTEITSKDNITYSGYIQKKARGRSFIGRRNWKIRFITINKYNGDLHYYTDSDSVAPKGHINIAGSEIKLISNKELNFEVRNKKNESISFSAFDNNQLDAWLLIFKEASLSAGKFKKIVFIHLMVI